MRVRIHDLSLGGCLLEAPLNIDIGRRLTLRLNVPGDDWLSLQGETVRVAPPAKFAVKFVDMDQTTEHRLQRVLDHLAFSRTSSATMDGNADV